MEPKAPHWYSWLSPTLWWKRYQRHHDARILFPRLAAVSGNNATFLAVAIFEHMKRNEAWKVPYWQLTKFERWTWEAVCNTLGRHESFE